MLAFSQNSTNYRADFDIYPIMPLIEEAVSWLFSQRFFGLTRSLASLLTAPLLLLSSKHFSWAHAELFPSPFPSSPLEGFHINSGYINKRVFHGT